MIFSYLVRCPPGLDIRLEEELRKLLPRATLARPRANGLIRVSLFDDNPSVAGNPVDRTLTTLVLNSRVANGLFFEVGTPFRSEWENQLREGLRDVPWRTCFKKGSQFPNISVRTSRSRLAEAGYVRRLVRESMVEYLGEPIPRQKADPETNTPLLAIRIEEDIVRVYVDAGGPNLMRTQFECFDSHSRLNISEQIAAGTARRSFSKILDRCNRPTTIWDPFSGSGVLGLTTAKTIAGIPAGSPFTPFPFRSFASHDPKIYGEVAEELRLSQHDNVGVIDKFLLSDSSIDAIKITDRNLETFSNSLPLIDGKPVIHFPLNTERKPDAYIPPEADSLAIITALPAGNDTERKYRKFDAMLDQVKDKLIGCVVLTNKPAEFRRTSKRKWVTELRMFDGRRFIESLNLVS
jgi:23S rRNA G2445 N2-methylase RlmL